MADEKGNAILEIESLTKRFGRMTAVDDVSFSLERGRLVTFVGPSGCGKTTLLRMISGFCEPDRGRIILDGEDITHASANSRDTAMVFQNYALFPHLSVARNIGFGLELTGMPKKETEARVEKLLALVQLSGLGDRRPHELSGGQQQRVAVARALSLNPKILLLDEPLSNLDANLRVSMRGEIRKLQRELGLSIIFVTHDQEEAMSISDLLVVMEGGRVRQIGTPTAVYERPVDEFVANFVGHINFFEGRVVDISGDGMVLRTAAGDLTVERPGCDVSPGERMKAVVRPESIDIMDPDADTGGRDNVIFGEVETTMYIGAVMRYTISVNGMTVYLDEPDPQYRAVYNEGRRVKLRLKSRLHLLKN